MAKIQIGYDNNLGFPNDFTTKMSCDIIPKHNLSDLIKSFDNKEFDAIFIPSGTLPYIKNYKIISQSLFGEDYRDTLTTHFITTEAITIENIANKKLGRVNQYCTTSYWAPLIYLMSYLPEYSRLNFENADSFQDLYNKTVQGSIDGCMMWEAILKENKKTLNHLHQVFKLNNLPTPVLITQEEWSNDRIEIINQFKSKDNKSFFRGFKKPDLDAIQAFQLAIKKAIDFYRLDI